MNLGAISLNKDKSSKGSNFFGLDLKKKKKKSMEDRKSSSVSDVGAWGMNIVSSVGIIMANKQLMSQTGFAFSFGLYLFLLFQFRISLPLVLQSVVTFLFYSTMGFSSFDAEVISKFFIPTHSSLLVSCLDCRCRFNCIEL